MRFEDKIPHIDKVANFIVGFTLAAMLVGVVGYGFTLASIVTIAAFKEIWWDRNYDTANVDWWDFVALMSGAAIAAIFF
jgi:hypothetical protein